ncbi:hypothetical protein DSO57_1008917 [Entomophthora muscae]|uniref:Uncharacterized protein n=1 Tax=Entomophthora muscae TaxID=34485 RepID=A0ACC2T6Y6_9FUNG|nr:hypothetical protein DSO57_1008917 [Entomophthora muscae]
MQACIPYPPGHTPVVLSKLPRALDLEYFHPHHLDLPPVMKDIPTAPLLSEALFTQDFSKLGFIYITVLGLADQVVPHTGSWRPLATALNYLVRIAPIVYMAFQARPASPLGVQPDSSMGHVILSEDGDRQGSYQRILQESLEEYCLAGLRQAVA